MHFFLNKFWNTTKYIIIKSWYFVLLSTNISFSSLGWECCLFVSRASIWGTSFNFLAIIRFNCIYEKKTLVILTLKAQTPQNGQTHSNDSPTNADELFEQRFKVKNRMFKISFERAEMLTSFFLDDYITMHRFI